VLLWGAGFLAAASGEAQAEPRLAGLVQREGLPAEVELPFPVRVAVRVLNITQLREVSGQARAHIEITQSWTDPRQRFDPLVAGAARLDRTGADADAFLATLWVPGLAIDNLIGTPPQRIRAVSAHADGRIVLVERFEADFRSTMSLAAFPFDRQQITLSFSLPRFASAEAILIATEADRAMSRIDQPLSVVDWRPVGLDFHYDEAPGWNARYYARLNATVTLERRSDRYILRIFVPIVAILMVSLFVLWVPALPAKDKGGLVFSGLLALAALSFTFEASFQGAISTDTPVSQIISLAYFYLVVVLLVDTVTSPGTLAEGTAGRRVAIVVRTQAQWVLPLIMTILSIAIVVRSLPV
jgi:hypothetical protein